MAAGLGKDEEKKPPFVMAYGFAGEPSPCAYGCGIRPHGRVRLGELF